MIKKLNSNSDYTWAQTPMLYSSEHSPMGCKTAYCMSAVDIDTCFFMSKVTDDKYIYCFKTTNGGDDWDSILRIDSTGLGTISFGIYGIDFFSSLVGIASYNVTGAKPVIKVTKNGGTTWTNVSDALLAIGDKICSIKFGSSANSVWFSTVDSTSTSPKVYFVDLTTAPYTPVLQLDLTAVAYCSLSYLAMFNDLVGYIVVNRPIMAGPSRLYGTTDGATWGLISSLDSDMEGLIRSISIVKSTNPAIGDSDYIYLTTGATPTKIWKSSNAGINFTGITLSGLTGWNVSSFSPTNGYFLSPTLGYFVSSENIVLYTTDGLSTINHTRFIESEGNGYSIVCFDKDQFWVGKANTTNYPIERYYKSTTGLSTDEQTFITDLKSTFSNFCEGISRKEYFGCCKVSDKIKVCLIESYYNMILKYFSQTDSTDAKLCTASEMWDVIQAFNDICNSTLYINIGQ